MWQEVRFAARKLIRQPGFSAAVIILMALGVGAGTAVFTVVNALLLTPPPLIREPERVVRLNAAEPGTIGISTYPDYVEVRNQARVFSHLFGYDGAATTVQLRSKEQLAEADARFVTGNYFAGLGVPALAGRLLVVSDDDEQAQNVLVISEPLQRRWFGSPRAALGSTLQVNGQMFSIVGVVPAGFRGAARDDAPVDLWLPVWKRPLVTGRPRMDMERTPDYVHAFMNTMGRLRPGVSPAQAQANLDAIILPLMQAQPTSAGLRATVSTSFGLSPTRRATVITIARLIGALAVIVLLIVCANLANLTLARAVARRAELTVKLALGAGRWRLIQQMGIETGLLALAGGVVGLACAYWAARGLAAFLPFELAAAPAPDLRVFAFALLLAALTALACALAPALLTTRTSAAHTAGARTLGGGGAAARTALVITQVALCFMLLSGAALFVRTLSRIHAVPLGFNPQNVLAITFDLRAHGYNERTAPLMFDRIAERMRSLPGVQSVALGSIVPLSGARRTGSVEIEGRPINPAQRLVLDQNVVSPGYFRTMQTRLLSGRDLTSADAAGGPEVIIINHTMANRYWPNQNPIGKRVRRGDGPWIEVVGVVADTRTLDVTEPPVPMFYRAFAQAFFPRMAVYLRTTGDAAGLMDPARRAVAELDPNLVPRSVNTLERVHADAIRGYTANARLVVVLGVIALMLAALGLYAVTSYLVTQRTREFGLRLAIGAQPSDLLRHVLGGALQRAALGIVIGLLGSVALVQLTERFLFELSPTDPKALAAAALLLGASVALASWLPARRATRVDPVVALRAE